MKGIKNILLAIFALLIVLLIALYFYAGSVIKFGVEKFVPPITQTDVKVGNVDISFLKGSFELKNLVISNPKGFKIKNAFSVKNVKVVVDIPSLFTNKIIVKKVQITQPVASVEIQPKGMNLLLINKAVQSYVSHEEHKTEQKEKALKQVPSNTKMVVIKDLVFEKPVLQLGALGASADIPLPSIEQKNIGEKKKTTLAQGIANVLEIFSKNTLNAAKTAVVQQGKNAIKAVKDSIAPTTDTVKDAVKGLKDLF